VVTMNDGRAFEERVEFLLGLQPSCRLERHQRIAGKDIDLVAHVDAGIAGPQVVAVECKDHDRALSRERIREVLFDYAPIVDKGLVDGLLLVTRNGVVAGASEALAVTRAQHVTERQLLERVFSVEPLLREADQLFAADGLSHYYQEAMAYTPTFELATANFEVYYGKAADEVIESLELATMSMSLDKSPPRARLGGDGGDGLLSTVVRDRVARRAAPLQPFVDRWLGAPAGVGTRGLAVLGSYGTGKSSYAKSLAARQAARYRQGESDRVPLLVELRHFGSHQSLEGLLTDHLANRLGLSNSSFGTFAALNAAGRLLVILDGFDEMKEGMTRDALSYNFAELNRLLAGSVKVVLCGRPTVFESQGEQRYVLTAARHEEATRPSYLQVDIAPMDTPTVKRAISRYVAARREDLGPEIDARVHELDNELDRSDTLRSLLARPVHFPMLLRVLPTWTGPLAELTRSALYGEFIGETIRREMKPGRMPSIGAQQRERFAADLATAMFALGSSRSIRYGLIPDDIVAPHRRGHEQLESTRRDLVKSCFLERKSPDILFFPHKSFAEFLVAERFLREMKLAHPRTDDIEVKLTPEIASFLDERLINDHWPRALAHLSDNTSLVRFFFRELAGEGEAVVARGEGFPAYASLRCAVADDALFAPLHQTAALLHAGRAVQYAIAVGLERILRDGHGTLADAALPCLRAIAVQGDDVAAVHAFRALSLHSGASATNVISIAASRWQVWRDKGWVSLPLHLGALSRQRLRRALEAAGVAQVDLGRMGGWSDRASGVTCSIAELRRLGLGDRELGPLNLAGASPEQLLVSSAAAARLRLWPEVYRPVGHPIEILRLVPDYARGVRYLAIEDGRVVFSAFGWRALDLKLKNKPPGDDEGEAPRAPEAAE